MEKTFFITTYRSQEDLTATLHNEIDPRITLEPWREDAPGFYIMQLPEDVDFYHTYELFHFLRFNVTYINVPVQFMIEQDTGFGNRKSIEHREPLASWKNIDRSFILDPVPVDRMTGQIEDRMGLGKILSVEKQRTNVPLMGTTRETNTKRTYIIEFGSDRKDKETVHEIEVTVYRDGEKLDWEEDLRQQINMKLHDLLLANKRLTWVFARKLGTKPIIQEMTAASLKKPTR